MFADLDETIKQLLIQRGGLDSGEIDISFDMPTREWAAGISKPTVNLYLFDIRENLELKNHVPWTVRRGPNNTAIKNRTDVRVDIRYVVTTFANSMEDEHRLLHRVLITLLQYPALPEEILEGQVAGQEVNTFTSKPSSVIQSPADYWGALDNDIKPSIEYQTTLRLDLDQEMSVGLALTSQFKVGRKISKNGFENVDELPYHIGGKIHEAADTEVGIPAAKVTLLERALDSITGGDGRYSFAGVPAGEYTLVISAPGLDDQIRTLLVPNNNYDVGI
jgi:hypothetical protein